jgi:hypothetical protein
MGTLAGAFALETTSSLTDEIPVRTSSLFQAGPRVVCLGVGYGRHLLLCIVSGVSRESPGSVGSNRPVCDDPPAIYALARANLIWGSAVQPSRYRRLHGPLSRAASSVYASTAARLHVDSRGRRRVPGKKLVWATVPITIIWTNLHGGVPCVGSLRWNFPVEWRS